MIRKVGWVLSAIGLISLIALVYGWINNKPISSPTLLGVLLLLLGIVLSSRPSTANSEETVAPSTRKRRSVHKSWLSGREDNRR